MPRYQKAVLTSIALALASLLALRKAGKPGRGAGPLPEICRSCGESSFTAPEPARSCLGRTHEPNTVR